MNGRSVTSGGFTLVEVLLALAVLAIAVFALVQLQAVSLRNTALAADLTGITSVVRSELELRRFSDGDYVEPGSVEDAEIDVEPDHGFEPVYMDEAECLSATDWGGDCAVTLSSCNFSLRGVGARAELRCDVEAFLDEEDIGLIVSYVRVAGESSRGSLLALQSFATSIYVAGGTFSDPEGD